MMKSLFVAIAVTAATGLNTSAYADDNSPSFDCSGKLSVVEKQICNVPELAKLDQQLSKAYQDAALAAQGADATATLKSGQKDFLSTRNSCNEDVACIGAAYRKRIAALTSQANAQSASNTKAPAADPGDSNAIPFVFDNQLDQYAVSGTWFPLASSNEQGGLSGPVVVQLKDTKTGRIIKVAENGIALLNDDSLGEHQIPAQKPDGGWGPAIASLKSAGTIHLDYGQKDRAQKGACENSKDTCLQWGDSPIDLQDLNFDGKPEIVFTQDHMGQRFGDAYRVHTLDFDDDSDDPKADMGTVTYNDEPFEPAFGQLDDQSTIDLTKKQIVILSSGGACASSTETYGLNPDGGFSAVGFEAWQTEGDKCMDQIYQIKTSESGAETWKLISSKEAKN